MLLGCGKRYGIGEVETPIRRATRGIVIGGIQDWSGRGVSEIATHPCEQIGQWIAARERDPDLARGDPDARSDLEQLEPDRVALRLGQIRVFEPQPAKSAHYQIRDRREPEP